MKWIVKTGGQEERFDEMAGGESIVIVNNEQTWFDAQPLFEVDFN